MSETGILKPALFLDRDGIINREVGYISKPEQLIFNLEIFRICRFFKQNFYKIIVVTNQSGLGRGLISKSEYKNINLILNKKFEEEYCELDLILTATLDPNNISPSKVATLMRKPNPGMLYLAQSKLNLDLRNSILIGDNLIDVQAGFSAGVGHLFLVNPKGSSTKYFETYSSLCDLIERLKIVFDPNATHNWS